MKLLAILLLFGVGVTLSSAIYFQCFNDGDTVGCPLGYKCHYHYCVPIGREKREAVTMCKSDLDCGKEVCLFGFCSSDDTKHKFERLKKAKGIRTRKKSKKIEKRSTWPHCVDDFECKENENCHGGVCRKEYP